MKKTKLEESEARKTRMGILSLRNDYPELNHKGAHALTGSRSAMKSSLLKMRSHDSPKRKKPKPRRHHEQEMSL